MMAALEIAAVSAGASDSILEEKLQVVEDPEEKEVVMVEEPEENPAEVEDEMVVAPEEVVEAVEALSTEGTNGMEVAPAVEVEAGAVDPAEEMEKVDLAPLEAAAPSSAREPGEEILAEVLEAAAELVEVIPVSAAEEPHLESTPTLEEAEVRSVAAPTSEADVEEIAATVITEEAESTAAVEVELAGAPAPTGEEASLAEEPMATDEAEELTDTVVEQTETPVINETLAAASPSSSLEVAPVTEVVLGAVEPSEEAAAPPAGLEAQVAGEAMVEAESTLQPSPPAKEHETAVLEDAVKAESLSEEAETGPMLEETEAQIFTADIEPAEALSQTALENKEPEESGKTVKAGCQLM
ncbi:hypothetical protein AAFF_G00180770 [Aldrovandia affinis]|uniref:Uncharacterized protein n=1 Tax=Aldrovandia affinis TaxID=143900 RepID=A0AAD7WVR5_9TELE|nr:hypothetical protein AAFF_G00180770 [Aldrovandia affinis]